MLQTKKSTFTLTDQSTNIANFRADITFRNTIQMTFGLISFSNLSNSEEIMIDENTDRKLVNRTAVEDEAAVETSLKHVDESLAQSA